LYQLPIQMYTRMSSQKQKKAIKKADTYNTIKTLS
jgi:hypothetical protein